MVCFQIVVHPLPLVVQSLSDLPSARILSAITVPSVTELEKLVCSPKYPTFDSKTQRSERKVSHSGTVAYILDFASEGVQ
ncbi:hypothetical protein CHS0354_029182, partial [Potamilus streckersoni]